MNSQLKLKNILIDIYEYICKRIAIVDKFGDYSFANIVALILILISFYPHLKTLDVPLYEDELYHVTDDVAYGEISSIDPFDNNYEFLGHPPGYRITLFLWFKIFPKSSYSARAMAILISFVTLLFLFLILKERLSFLYCLILTLSVHLVPSYSLSINSATGNMHEILLIFMCIYFTLKKKYILTSVIFLFLTMSRETGLSFLALFLVVICFEKMALKEKVKVSLIALLPGVLALAYFFIKNYILFDIFSNHPYATDKLAHIPKNYGFFEINDYKLKNLKVIIRAFNDRMLQSYFVICVVANLVIMFKSLKEIYRHKVISHLNLIPFLLVFISFIFLTFYSLYGDHVSRDLLICYMLFLVNLGVMLDLSFKKFGKLIFIIFISAVVIARGSIVQIFTNPLFVKNYVFHAKKIQKLVDKENICLPWPFNFAMDEIHEWFDTPIEFENECTSTRYFALHNSVHKSINDKRRTIIKEHNAKKVYHFKFEDRWLELYKTEKEVDVSY